jgi:hypothetical protein
MKISKFYKSLNQQEKVDLAECLKNEGFETQNKSALIPEWIKIHKDLMSARLEAVLMKMYRNGFKFIDQIDKMNFLCCRNVGIISWNEFVKLKNDVDSMST